MSFDQAAAFAIIIGLMVLFVWERFRFDMVALMGLAAALAVGIVPADKAFSGFSDQVVVIVGSALVLSAGVSKSRLIGRSIRRIEPYMTTTGIRVSVLAGAVAVLSSFVKNIGALAIFLPIALQIARRSGTSPATLLMPMAFGSLVGGIVTLVGTSPNILVSRVREELTGKPFAMFDFAPVGLGILAAGLAFLAFGWRLLPADRKGQVPAENAFQVNPYLIEAVVPPGSPFVNKTVANLEALAEGGVSVTSIIREGGRRYVPAGHWWIFEGDVLILQGDAHALSALTEEAELDVAALSKEPAPDVSAADTCTIEAVIMAGSPLIGHTIRELRLRDRFGVNLVAVSRAGQPGHTRLISTRFRVGDVVILQGIAEGASDTLRRLECLPLVDRSLGFGTPRKDYLPLAILAAAILLIATHVVPVTVAFFAAAVLVALTGVLTLDEAYAAMDPPILVLLACLIPISDAISSTGAAGLIAGWLGSVSALLPPVGAVALVMAAAMAVTPFLNNAATVLIMAPVAAGVAKNLGLNPDPFLMAVAIGAACDFLTPIGHQCNTLVMGPGGYRFGDYARLGLPLSIIVLVLGTLLIPIFWTL